MRRIPRILLLTVFIGVLPVLAGCADFDPDKLDVFGLGEKKKLPGDRKDVFPEGVPGVSQGIPKEYIRGNEQQQMGAAIPVDPAAVAPAAEPVQASPASAPAAEPKPKPKRVAKIKPAPKPAPKPTTEAKPAAVPVQPVAQEPAQPPAAWPASPPQGQQQGRISNGTAPWPSAPPPGTFSQ